MITDFRGENRWLSNFSEHPVVYGNRSYRNSESAYQAQKFLSESIRLEFEGTSGAEAKKLAKHKKDFMRRDWLKVNLGFMSEIIHAKFTQNKDIRELLVLTYPQELIEGNTWNDVFWGVCSGTGQNWLGRILMAERIFWLDLQVNDRQYKDDRLVKAFEAQLDETKV